MKQRHSYETKRANLPTKGQVRGIITLMQEDRFRIEDDRGHGYLFTLGRGAGATVSDLYRWGGQNKPIVVNYQGPPDLGAVAVRVRGDGQLTAYSDEATPWLT